MSGKNLTLKNFNTQKLFLPDRSYWALLSFIFALTQALATGLAEPLYSVAFRALAILGSFAGSFVPFSILPLGAIVLCHFGFSRIYRTLIILSPYLIIFALADILFYSIMGSHLTVAATLAFTGKWHDFVVTLRETQVPERAYYSTAIAILGVVPLTHWVHFVCSRRDTKNSYRTAHLGHLLILWCASFFITSLHQGIAKQFGKQDQFAAELQSSVFVPTIIAPRSSQLFYAVVPKPVSKLDAYPNNFDPALSPIQTTTQNINVFYFIMESFRGDFITADIAPNLFKLQNEEITFSHAVANANSTHVSWDAMYQSSLPLYWNVHRKNKHFKGSLPLREFKNAGFKIHIFATPNDSEFWNAKKVYFGDPPLFDSYFETSDYIDPGENKDPQSMTDEQILNAAMKKISLIGNTGRNLFILNLDSAHHRYHWAANYTPKFKPYSEMASVPALRIQANAAEKIKNRYLNSLNYVDGLLGRFFQFLKEKNLYASAIMAIVGDHGQEFFEHRAFAHGGNLFNTQIKIALALKIPGIKKDQLPEVASQADVLPTLLDAVGAYREGAFANLEGRSLLRISENNHFVVSFEANGSQTPYKGALVNSFGKILFQLDRANPLASKYIRITDLLDHNDKRLVDPSSHLDEAEKLVHEKFFTDLKRMRFLESIEEK